MKKVRTAIVGCGTLARKGVLPHLDKIDARAQIDLVAVCDLDEERARNTAKTYDVPSFCSDPSMLFERDDVDFVLILTPIAAHYALATEALASGKHIYVQKTMTQTYREAREIVELADSVQRVVVAAPGQMLSSAARTIDGWLRSGALGEIYWAWGNTSGWGNTSQPLHDTFGSIDPSWHYQHGGPIREQAVYVLHTLTGLLGPVQGVSAMSGIAAKERYLGDSEISLAVDDNTIMLLDFGDVTFGVVGGHGSRPGRLVSWGSFGIYGSEGAVETLAVDNRSGFPSEVSVHSTQPLSELEGENAGVYVPETLTGNISKEHNLIAEPHVYADIMHGVECILDGSQPIPSASHAAHVIEVIEGGYLAAQQGDTFKPTSTFDYR